MTSFLPEGWAADLIETQVAPVEEQLADAMQKAGLEPPFPLRFDGRLHRFSTSGKRGDDSGWYVAYGEGVAAGAFGDWRTGISQTWRADAGRELSVAEQLQQKKHMERIRAARDEEKAARQQAAASVVVDIWDKATPASPDHPYLLDKAVPVHDLRATGDNRLIIPIINMDGDLRTLQYIGPNESNDALNAKKYHAGGAIQGNFYAFGSPSEEVILCEGWATGASIYQATGVCTIVTFSAGNLVEVSKVFHERLPSLRQIIVADKDDHGVGEAKAYEAATHSGARVVVPPEGDANDYARSGGDLRALIYSHADRYTHDIVDLLKAPQRQEWLIKGWLPKRGLCFLYGPSGAGKTFVALDWALHIAVGMEWMSCRTNGGPVVYLSGEGNYGMTWRVMAWCKHHDIALSRNLFRVSDGAVDLNTVQGLSRVVNDLDQLPQTPSVIFVDTLYRFFMGNENSAEDTRQMVDHADQLHRRYGCCVVFVHHTGVGTDDRMRGSSSLRAAADMEYRLSGTMQEGIILEHTKAKDSAEQKPIMLLAKEMELARDEDGDPINSMVLVPNKDATPVVPPQIKGVMHWVCGAWAYDRNVRAGEGGDIPAGMVDASNRPMVHKDVVKHFMRESTGTDSLGKNMFRRDDPKRRTIYTAVKLGYLHIEGDLISVDHQGLALAMQSTTGYLPFLSPD